MDSNTGDIFFRFVSYLWWTLSPTPPAKGISSLWKPIINHFISTLSGYEMIMANAIEKIFLQQMYARHSLLK